MNRIVTRLRSLKVTPAMLVALVALFLSVGTSAWAVVRVTSQNIVDGSVKTIDIGNSEVRSVDIRNGAVQRADLAAAAVYNPGTWTKVADAAGATFGTDWVDFGGGYQEASYRKDSNGYVYVRGAIANTAGNIASSVAITFPAGFRPEKEETFSISSTNGLGAVNPTDSMVDLAPDGSLYVYGDVDDDFVSLDGISFLAVN